MKWDGLLSGWRVRRTLGRNQYGSVWELEKKDAFGGIDRCVLKAVSIRLGKGESEETMNQRVEALAARLRKASALWPGGDILGYDDRWILPRSSGAGWHIYLKMDYLEPVQVWRRQFRGAEELLRLTGKPETYEAQIKTYLERTRIRDEVVVRLGTAVCRVLERQHRQGIGFCNVKPSNVFTDGAGNFLLGDPGLGELALEVSGDFLPPEADPGREPEENWDVYGLGLTLYWLLNDARAPFLPGLPEPVTEEQRLEAQKKRLAGQRLPPPRYGCPRLQNAVLRACAPNPGARFQTLEAFRKVLEQALTAEQPERPSEVWRNMMEAFRKSAERSDKPSEAASPTEPTAAESGSPVKLNPENSSGEGLTAFKGDAIHIATGQTNTLAIRTDGTILSVGINIDGVHEANGWRDLIALSVGSSHSLGLRADGRVIAAGWNKNSQCNVQDWREITQIAAGYYHSVGLRRDGTVVTVGDDRDEKHLILGWREIVSVSAGYRFTVGLRSDGTVVAVGNDSGGQCKVGAWRNIQQVSAGFAHTVGLLADGTAVAAGSNLYGQCDVSSWRELIGISAGKFHTVGLKRDGTVVVVGCLQKKDDLAPWKSIMEQWKNVVEICAGDGITVAVCADGRALAAGNELLNQSKVVNEWSGIQTGCLTSATSFKTPGPLDEPKKPSAPPRAGTAAAKWSISAGIGHILGIQTDGSVVSVGDPEAGAVRARKWKKIVMVAAGNCHSVGLRENGTVIAAGESVNGCCDVTGWRGILAVSAGRTVTIGLMTDGRVISTSYAGGLAALKEWQEIEAISAAGRHAIGLRHDGTVVVTGGCGEASQVSGWTDIVAVAGGLMHTVGLRRDGTVVWAGKSQCGWDEMNTWQNMTAIAAGDRHTVGLRADGRVLSCGSNENGQREVSGWRDVIAIACGSSFTLGLKRSGSVLLAGHVPLGMVTGWRDLRVVK